MPNPNVSYFSGESRSTLHTEPPRSPTTTASSLRQWGGLGPLGGGWERLGHAWLLTWTWELGRYTHRSKGRLYPSSGTWYGWLPCILLTFTSPEPYASPASQATLRVLLPCTNLCYLGKHAYACYMNYMIYNIHYIVYWYKMIINIIIKMK